MEAEIQVIITTLVGCLPAIAAIVAAIFNAIKNNSIVNKATEATQVVIDTKFSCTNKAIEDLTKSVEQLTEENASLRTQMQMILEENAQLKKTITVLCSHIDKIEYQDGEV